MDSLHIEQVKRDSVITCNLGGRFDFKTHPLFRDAMAGILGDPQIGTIELRLDHLHYLDSSALGVLLKTWNDAHTHQKTIRLLNPRGVVAQALEIAQFHKLFDIESV